MSGGREAEPLDLGRGGSLDEVDLRRLYALAFRRGVTGVLRVVQGSRVTELCFLQGRIADAVSSLPEAELGNLLLRHGKVRAERLRLARDTLEPGGGLGERLVRLGAVSPEDLSWGQRERVAWIARNLLDWREGTWKFFQGPPARQTEAVGLSPLEVVVRQHLEEGEEEHALARLGGEEARLRLPDHSLPLLSTVEAPEEFDYLLVLLDRGLPLAEAVARSQVPRGEALCYLDALLELDILEPVREADGPAKARPLGETQRHGPEEAEPAGGGETPRRKEDPPKTTPLPGQPEGGVCPPSPRTRSEPADPSEEEASPTVETVAVGAGQEGGAAENATVPSSTARKEVPVPTAQGPLEVGTRRDAALPDRSPSSEEEAPGPDSEKPGGASVLGDILAQGTLVEVLFALALLALVFAAVLYIGRNYLSGLREELVETRIVDGSSREALRDEVRALPPGSASRVLAEMEFRYLDSEPPLEPPPPDPSIQELVSRTDYRRAREEFEAGNYGRAAEEWSAMLSASGPSGRSVRVERACSPEDLRRAARRAGPGFFAVPGESGCFQVFWGLFEDDDRAREAWRGRAGAGSPGPVELVAPEPGEGTRP